ncbi:MAG: hypothetical protein AAGA30_06575, partial [Planctomycetota bacterium]
MSELGQSEIDTLISKALEGSLAHGEYLYLQNLLNVDDAALKIYLDSVAVEMLLEEQAVEPQVRTSVELKPKIDPIPWLGRWAPMLAASVLFLLTLSFLLADRFSPSSVGIKSKRG